MKDKKKEIKKRMKGSGDLVGIWGGGAKGEGRRRGQRGIGGKMAKVEGENRTEKKKGEKGDRVRAGRRERPEGKQRSVEVLYMFWRWLRKDQSLPNITESRENRRFGCA